MSYPNKAKGLRSITVRGTRYRWRVQFGEVDSQVLLYGSESGRQLTSVRLPGVRDFWLTFPEYAGTGEGGMIIIKPRLVRQLIEEALVRGWRPEQRGAPLTFDFEPAKPAD